MRNDTFSTYHPVINFTYFILVAGLSMFVMHPVFLGISMTSGFAYYVYLKGKKALRTIICFFVPIFLLSSIVNPLFNHKGMTLLFYLKSGNPITLESILYGLAAGVMIVSVLAWCSCYQCVMNSDKFIYLFGKLIPALSLLLAMVLRFVPKFSAQIHKVSDAQKCIGRDVSNGKLPARLKNGMKILSIMVTWALENSVETADSMKARGYGLRGRTQFSVYRFDSRDKMMFAGMAAAGIFLAVILIFKKIFVFYYPILVLNEHTALACLAYCVYGLFCFLPLAVDIVEDIKWHYLKSKI